MLAFPAGVPRLLINSKSIIGDNVFDWSQDGNKVITMLDKNYFSTDTNSSTNSINLNLMFRNIQGKNINDWSDIKEIKFLPDNNNQFTVWTQKGLYLVDTSAYAVTIISNEPINSYSSNSDEIIFSYGDNLMAYKTSFKTIDNLINHKCNKILDIQISSSGYFISTIEDNNSLDA